jgi:hypothetical protein
VDAAIIPPLPTIVYQTPGAVGIEAKPQLGASSTVVAPAEVDPNKDKELLNPGLMGPKASTQESLSTIRSPAINESLASGKRAKKSVNDVPIKSMKVMKIK